MKAWVVERPARVAERALRLVEVPEPEPGPGQVAVRVQVCGVCRTDLHVVEGDLPQVRARVVPGHQAVGEVERVGAGVRGLWPGQRVGVTWLGAACGVCRFCAGGRENLCTEARFTGWTIDGGFAEVLCAEAAFVHPLPEAADAVHLAPLLCAGIIGHRCLEHTGVGRRPGARLCIYGFGAAGHVVLQVARGRGLEVYVATRDAVRHQPLARELGAAWVGDATATPPVPMDAGIVFAPAGELVPVALGHLDRGGVLVLGGIHMSPIPSLPYAGLYHERVVRSVANHTRADARAFLAEAAALPVRTQVEEAGFADLPDVLVRLAGDGVRGAAVIRVRG